MKESTGSTGRLLKHSIKGRKIEKERGTNQCSVIIFSLLRLECIRFVLHAVGLDSLHGERTE